MCVQGTCVAACELAAPARPACNHTWVHPHMGDGCACDEAVSEMVCALAW
jgi:hypothetical protein